MCRSGSCLAQNSAATRPKLKVDAALARRTSMAPLSFPGLLVLSSLVLLIHATLCAIQRAREKIDPAHARTRIRRRNSILFFFTLADRDYLKAVQQPFIYSPFAVSMQCIGAVCLGTWGILGVQGSFLPIRTTEVMAKQTIDSLEPGPDFMHFNTRQPR